MVLVIYNICKDLNVNKIIPKSHIDTDTVGNSYIKFNQDSLTRT